MADNNCCIISCFCNCRKEMTVEARAVVVVAGLLLLLLLLLLLTGAKGLKLGGKDDDDEVPLLEGKRGSWFGSGSAAASSTGIVMGLLGWFRLVVAKGSGTKAATPEGISHRLTKRSVGAFMVVSSGNRSQGASGTVPNPTTLSLVDDTQAKKVDIPSERVVSLV